MIDSIKLLFISLVIDFWREVSSGERQLLAASATGSLLGRAANLFSWLGSRFPFQRG